MIDFSNEFLGIIQKPADGTRPSRTTSPGSGVSFVLGGSNVEGAYTQILDGSTEWPAGFGDGFVFMLQFANTNLTTFANPGLATIGIDLAGGTTYTEWIHDLICGPTSNHEDASIIYRLPIRVPNGASLAVKAQCLDATPPSNPDVLFRILGKPTRPELVRAGSFVRTFGAVTATSEGTGITPGTTSEGAYVELGTLADDIWGWEFGMTINNTVVSSNIHNVDIAIGDATNKRRVLRNERIGSTTSEAVIKQQPGFDFGSGLSGDKVYGRSQSEIATTGASLIVYGIGG